MIPTDGEFSILYVVYGIMAIFLVTGLISSTKRKYFISNSVVFLCYLIFMIYIFSDAENFKYGNSLAILFYGTLFVLSHFAILGLIKLTQIIMNK